jgi:hypothetical protein
MLKAWQENITTSWLYGVFSTIYYNPDNPSGLKTSPDYIIRKLDTEPFYEKP